MAAWSAAGIDLPSIAVNLSPLQVSGDTPRLVADVLTQSGLAGTRLELEITETEPGIQGDRVSGARKPATLQTGKVIQVPLFVNIGDKVKVDTRTGDYITRV